MSEEVVDPKAPEWYRLEITKMREQRRTEQEAAAKAHADLIAKLEATAKAQAEAQALAGKAQAERDRVQRQFAMHREGLTSERFQRQLLRDYDEITVEQGEIAPKFADWLAEQKKDPDVSAFFKATVAPAPSPTPAPAPANTPAPVPAPAPPNPDRGVVVQPPGVLAKDKDREVMELHRQGKLTGAALVDVLKAEGFSETDAKRLAGQR